MCVFVLKNNFFKIKICRLWNLCLYHCMVFTRPILYQSRSSKHNDKSRNKHKEQNVKTYWKRFSLWRLSSYSGSVLDKERREDRYSGKWRETIGSDHWQSIPDHQRSQRWWCWQLPIHCRQRCRINCQWRHCSRYVSLQLNHTQDEALSPER